MGTTRPSGVLQRATVMSSQPRGAITPRRLRRVHHDHDAGPHSLGIGAVGRPSLADLHSTTPNALKIPDGYTPQHAIAFGYPAATCRRLRPENRTSLRILINHEEELP
jgi:hypothetical protein